MRVWIIDQKIICSLTDNTKGYDVAASSDADESDNAMLEEGDPAAASSSQAPLLTTEHVPVAIKVEVKSRADIISERCQDIVRNPKPELHELSTVKIDEEAWLVKAKKEAYAGNLVTNILRHLSELQCAIDIISDINAGNNYDKSPVSQAALVTSLEQCAKQHEDIKK